MTPFVRLASALFAFALLACSGTIRAVPAAGLTEAAERARAGDDEGALASLGATLESTPSAVQEALLEPAFANGLRDTDAFREMIRSACTRFSIRRLQLVSRDEPGEWIEVRLTVVDPDGEPVPAAVVDLFATDEQGRYHPEIEGERVPRIFGTLVTDGEGRAAFETVLPGPYPGTRNVRHVHVRVRARDRRLAVPGYVVFDDDPLLEEPQNAEPRGEAVRIRMREVDGRRVGELELPVR